MHLAVLLLLAASLTGTAESEIARLTATRDHWQKLLGLSHWHIQVELVPRSALQPGKIGTINWSLAPKKATIKVLRAADYKRLPAEIAADQDVTVVHELVHLRLAELPLKDSEHEENAVEAITAALVSGANAEQMRRADQPRSPRHLPSSTSGGKGDLCSDRYAEHDLNSARLFPTAEAGKWRNRLPQVKSSVPKTK